MDEKQLNEIEVKLDLQVGEVNGILTALGQLPYAQVSGLIDKIRQQATPQVQAAQQAAAEQKPAE
jgi:hypothetical protein